MGDHLPIEYWRKYKECISDLIKHTKGHLKWNVNIDDIFGQSNVGHMTTAIGRMGWDSSWYLFQINLTFLFIIDLKWFGSLIKRL